MNHTHDKVGPLTNPSKSDQAAILDFHNRNFPSSKWREVYLERYFSETARNPICIAVKNGKKFNGLAIGKLSEINKTRLIFSSLLVSKPYRGKGYGDILIQEFFKSALEIPTLHAIDLHFRDSNSRVENFYRRFGFRKYKVREKYTNGEKKHSMKISRESIRKYLNLKIC